MSKKEQRQKSALERQSLETAVNRETCKTCKHHNNKPSYCNYHFFNCKREYICEDWARR